jgi:hypothetical protein
MVIFGILCFPLNETRSIARGGKKQRIFCGRGSSALTEHTSAQLAEQCAEFV